MLLRRCVRAWLLGGLAAGWAASGCTLLGAGVGAGIDAATPGPYEAVLPESFRELERDDPVVVFMRDGRRYQGRYIGVHGPTKRDPVSYILLDRSGEVLSVPASEVRRIAVEVSGKGWLYGGLVGAAIDTVVVVGFIVAATRKSINLSGTGMMSGT